MPDEKMPYTAPEIELVEWQADDAVALSGEFEYIPGTEY